MIEHDAQQPDTNPPYLESNTPEEGSRIDQTQSQSRPSRGSERLDWRRRGYDTTECFRSDPGVLPQHQALQLLA